MLTFVPHRTPLRSSSTPRRAPAAPSAPAPAALLAALAALLLGAAAGGCGDDGAAASPDAGAPDAPAPPDAAVCALAGYPAAVRPQSVDLTAPFTLRPDGVGDRCAQLGRALLDPDPAARPPELAELDVAGVTTTCHINADDQIAVVRIAAPQFAGLPLFAPPQDGVVWVDPDNVIVHLHADFLPRSAPAVPPACRSTDTLVDAVPGAALTYARYDQCQVAGEGSYALHADDTFVVGAEGYALDRDGQLRRVRAIEAYIAPARVTPEHVNSELYCCAPGETEACVGARLLVDALTGEVVTQQPLCHAC